MKLYNKYILFLAPLMLLAFWSCEDFLEEDPNFITEGTFYKTETDARLAVNGIYETLGGGAFNRNWEGVYFNNYWTAVALMSDEGIPGPLSYDANYMQLANYSLGPTNAVVANIWSDFYTSINAANLAIDNIPNIDMDTNLKSRLIGEARFLRGLFYFELVRMYNHVPLQLHATTSFNAESYLARTPSDKVYEQIIEDLTFAENNLPEEFTGKDKGRPTLWSAKAYLAKVALTLGNWQTAANKTEEVMAGPFGLWADYKEAFLIANNNGKESVFSINFDKGTSLELIWEGSHLNFRTMAQEYRAIPGAGGADLEVPTTRVYEVFDDLDRRKSVTFVTEDVINGENVVLSGPHIHKYWDRDAEPSGTPNTINDLQLIRYSDILLMHAEALNEINTGPTAAALNSINQVRERARNNAGTIENTLPDLEMTLSYNQFKEAILLERFKEFVWEGHRWFDLKRFNMFTEKVNEAKPGSAVRSDNVYFPIPQRERDTNTKLTQNDGY
ncbi:RagB/SusD family nutrient uptake outer membrane protein [Flavivirga eckloniae]|uniref:RagB/SusD family nutrient uptake outer membrane protein n=1 Tax=Flavivirga eckloniae TaxID=1803846 RepID=A0A2K9PUA9_9FLAO|nr:RagB/SusD family nutrient uptake outer membrane protein [Flavivirga eckloniae]AUP80643.1 RagB/SusD family nutrient uptake outer membrane protein [Flavivirga eckloniae]